MASLEFDEKASAIYLKIKEGKIHETNPITDNIIIDLNEKGEIIGIEILLPPKLKKEIKTKLVKTIIKVIEDYLENKITKNQASKTFLKIYTDTTPKPQWLEETLSTLILIDEEEKHGAPTQQELKQIINNIDETLKTIEKSKQPAWKTIREFRENPKCML